MAKPQEPGAPLPHSTSGWLRRIGSRISAKRRTNGWLAVPGMVWGYIRWRLKSRGFDGDGAELSEWLASHRMLRPPHEIDQTLITIVCPVYNTPKRYLDACILSIRMQTHPHWELVLVDDASDDAGTLERLVKWEAADPRIYVVHNPENYGIARSTNRILTEARGEYVLFMDHDDTLAPTALEWVASCTPDADLIYSDEDKIDTEGNHFLPTLKPAWSPRLLLNMNYVNHLTCVRTSILRDVGGLRPGFEGSQDHELLLRLSETPLTVAHLPNALYSWRRWPHALSAGSTTIDPDEAGRRAITEAVERREMNAVVGQGAGGPFNHRVRFNPEPSPPSVKVVIPTRDKPRRLEAAIEGVLERTDGVDVHLVIVDNGSKRASTFEVIEQAVLRHHNVDVISRDDSFNFSKLANQGAQAGAATDLTCFFNNDVRAVHRDWLLQLSGWLRDPDVVAVGPKLLFPDGTVQHAGIVLGMRGVAGHYSMGQRDQGAIGNLHDQAREVSAVTGACLLVRSADFAAVEGFDENLAVDFQDIDLCLRLQKELEGVIMYDPTYPLTHDQSASRGEGDADPYSASRVLYRWGDAISGDPFYNPHLTLDEYDLSLRPPAAADSERQTRLAPRLIESRGFATMGSVERS